MLKTVFSIFLMTSVMASSNDVDKIISMNPLIMKDFSYINKLDVKNKVKIAVIGDYVHPEEFQSIKPNYGEIDDNGIDDDQNGYVDDYYGFDANLNNGRLKTPVNSGHENGIISIMDAVVENYGLTDKVDILPINIYSFDGRFDEQRFKKMADSIDYAVIRGAKIISISQGISIFNRYSYIFIDNNYEKSMNYLKSSIDRAKKKGVIILGAVSNDNTRDHVDDPEVPANLDDVVAIANVNFNGVIQSGYGKNVDIAYYGTDIFVWEGRCSEFIKGYKGDCIKLNKTDGFRKVSGSSLSTPIVALSLGIISATGADIKMNNEFKSRLHSSCSSKLTTKKNIISKCIFSPEKLTESYLN